MSVIELTRENFEAEVIRSDMPVMIDFWANWCGPCQMLSPVIAEIAQDHDGKLKVGKVNVDEQSELAANFRVDSIPMVVIMKDGRVTSASVGYRSKEYLEDMLQKAI